MSDLNENSLENNTNGFLGRIFKRGPFKNWNKWSKNRKIITVAVILIAYLSLVGISGQSNNSSISGHGIPAPQGNEQAYNAGWDTIADLYGGTSAGSQGLGLPDVSTAVEDCAVSWQGDKLNWDEGDYVQGCVDATKAYIDVASGGNTSETIPHK